MTTTAATMNVRIGADIAPLQQGLKQAQASVDQSAKLMGTSLAGAASATDGSRVATEFVRGLKAEFAQANVGLKASLFQGQLTPEQFKAEGQKAAEQYNAGITAGLKQFGAQGILTPEIESKLVNSYKRAGLDAGDAVASGLTRSVTPATESAGRAFGVLGERGAKAGLMAGVAMSQLALDIGSAESASTKLVRGISDIALLFGPEGLLVAGILNAGLVMKQFFDKAQSDADATAKKFQDSIGALVNAGDIAELNRQKALIDFGSPSAGVGQGGGFKGGLKDLLARESALTSRTTLENGLPRRTGNNGAGAASSDATAVVMSSAADEKTLADIRQQIATLISQKQQIDASIALAQTIPKLLLPGGGTDTSGTAAGAKDPTASLVEQSQTLLGLQKNVAAGGDPLVELNGRMLASLVEVNAALADQADQYGAVALKLREVQAGLLGANDAAVRGLVGITPGAPSAPTGISIPSTLAGVPDQGKNIDLKNLPTIPSKLDVLGQIFKDSIAKQSTFIAQSLVTVLGIKQANAGGAIGSVIGGAVGGAVAGKVVGAAAGSVLGSVVPVVGTVIGSVVGGFIGNAIGGLFGGHKKAADNSASSLNALAAAANKVTEALSNVPTGFKIALARYEAATGLQVNTYGGGNGSTTAGPQPAVVVQNAHFYGVQDVAGMYEQLTTHAQKLGARGGVQPLSLALGV